MVYLYFNSNNLSGTIPPIGNMSTLLDFRLSGNQFQGSISPEIGSLGELQSLSLDSNLLTGGIPAELANCTKLAFLNLSNNPLGGSIPSALGKLQFLNKLNLGKDMLSGMIPVSLGNCSRLESISLDYNGLTGELPLSIAGLQSLEFSFDLSHNFLTGSIPPGLGGMLLLQYMDLSDNQFYGSIPTAIGSCASLLLLSLAQNSLNSSIPSSLTQLQALTYLNLSHNTLSGLLPVAMGNLKQLGQLDLSYNHFTGSLPPSLGNLSQLSNFNVSYNNFSGPIPDIGIYRNFTAQSFLGNIELCGSVLHIVCQALTVSSHGGLSLAAKIGIGIACAVLIASLLFILALCSWTRSKSLEPSPGNFVSFDPYYAVLTEKEILVATGGFSEENILGVGSVGSVYSAKFSDGNVVAVKKLISGRIAERSFVSELQSLGMVRHRNLVRIHGFYSSRNSKLLLMEFMANGSLEKHLHSEEKQCDLSWEERSRIIVGITHALVYLHHNCVPPIVHRDLKPSNILLDEDMEAHIGDFGIAKLINSDASVDYSAASTSLNVQGSIGYMAPECGFSLKTSPKSDVYSYGVILLELITGMRPTDSMFDDTTYGLTGWVQSCYPHNVREVLDKNLLKSWEILEDAVVQVVEVALMCTRDIPDDRPTMEVVLRIVENVQGLDKNLRNFLEDDIYTLDAT